LLRIRQDARLLAGSARIHPETARKERVGGSPRPTKRGPNVSLDQCPEKRSGQRSRLHLDLYTNDQTAEVDRLIRLGARRYPWRYQTDDDFVVLADPDDNLFCVVKTKK
jgi:Glyoxalase-like domain